MKIEWNKVTWYSKLIAVIVFVLTFIIAFKLGMAYEAQRAGVPWNFDDERGGMMHVWFDNDGNAEWGNSANSGATSAGLGEHCGGNIKDAATCAAGLHCQLKINMPDVGGTCVAN